MNCPSCGAENKAGRKFCVECGSALAFTCPSCGSPADPSDKYCGECGAVLASAAAATATPSPAPRAVPDSERRLVSVLFADLVGFTTLSESRDAEDVRELLSRYFDTSRQLIARYGGTVEKFIGDAVMAVWGTPVAKEDDAERAVRAGLDLTSSVALLGEEVGLPDLRARVGVLTGEAAVTIGAEAQGMVAGDLVNTASRIQSAAAPGEVFVGEATMRTTRASIVYEDAGSHELKGKTEPLPLWRAKRVVAGVGGALRSERLEAPFVGRERELRMMKDLFHASAEEGKAHLLSIVGIAGIGKSRLSWEFYKYMDGLRTVFRWHRGRCLAYGDGVTYWALAEMVRGRAGIEEGEEAASARSKLSATVAEFIPDPEERAWVEPRLAHLLGLEEREARERADLFAGWRLFFERIADRDPVVMAFEDMQWADAALLDFVEYLIEWSRDHPIFVITMARPELMDRRATWGAGRRNFTSLFLEPLPAGAMRDLLHGLAPGLPDDVEEKILDRAEGIPLYAVETVRMLLDRGALVQEGDAYRVEGPIDALAVPESLHALIAARLDGLSTEERRLVQDASVLGKTFTRDGIAALSGTTAEDLEPLLLGLVRKELLSIQADPRSPERGQIGFLQDLVKRVAYETLSRRDRRDRHLAVARYLETRLAAGEDDLVEVVASHYVEAYEAVPDAPEAAEIKERARETLAEAGEHAASLAASDPAHRYFLQAAGLADDPALRAGLLERAGSSAFQASRMDEAKAHLTEAIDAFDAAGLTRDAARASARLGDVDWTEGRLEDAIQRLEKALPVLLTEEPDETLARLLAQLGRMHYFKGDAARADERIEEALRIADPNWFPPVIAHALITKGLILDSDSRREEAMALMKHALELALEHDVPDAAGRAYNNLASFALTVDQLDAARDYAERGQALAMRMGDGPHGRFAGSKAAVAAIFRGDWDEGVALIDELVSTASEEEPVLENLGLVAFVRINRGDLAGGRACLDRISRLAESEIIDQRTGYQATESQYLLADGRPDEAVAMALRAWADLKAIGPAFAGVMFREVADAAFEAGRLDVADGLLDQVAGARRAEISPSVRAHATRLRSRIAAARGHDDRVEAGFKEAAGLFREIGFTFDLAVTQLEYGEWLMGQGRAEDAAPLLDEAGATFERLGARPWTARLSKVAPQRQAAPA